MQRSTISLHIEPNVLEDLKGVSVVLVAVHQPPQQEHPIPSVLLCSLTQNLIVPGGSASTTPWAAHTMAAFLFLSIHFGTRCVLRSIRTSTSTSTTARPLFPEPSSQSF